MSHFEYQQLPDPKVYRLAIRDLYKQTFGDSENPQEGETIGKLSLNLIEQSPSPSSDLYVFVATETNDAATGIIGCIIFSRLTFSATTTSAFLLAPVAVHTAYQRKGIGQTLLRFGIEALRSSTNNNNVDLIVTYGDPKYYRKVGFRQVTTDIIPSPFPLSQPMGWQAQSLKEGDDRIVGKIPGTCSCVPAFNNPEYW